MQRHMKNLSNQYALRKLLSYFLLILLFYGCVNTNAIFEPYKRIVSLDNKHFLRLYGASIDRSINLSSNRIYDIAFAESQGGTSYLFGFVKINEQNGHDYKRLQILNRDSIVIARFSINDLKQIDGDTVDLNMYLK